MKVIYIRNSRSRGYLRIGISDGENKFEYTVSESEYRELGSLLSGDEVTDTEQLRLCDMRYKGRLYALRILSYGDNNRSTLKRKLVSKSIPHSIAEEICTEMVGLGYINEVRQLERLVENEINQKLSGKRKVFRKLLFSGYKKQEIERVLDSLISRRVVDFEKSKKKLIIKKYPQGASEEQIRSLLYKYGYTDITLGEDYF